MAEEQTDQQLTKISRLAPSLPQRTSQEAMAISAILSRLALHYWRPDFTPAQVKLIMSDYLADLAGFAPEQIERACAEYRKNAENNFFPTPGQLLDLLKPTFEPPRRRLETFRGYPRLEAPRATKSVAQVLRENGFENAAASWNRGTSPANP